MMNTVRTVRRCVCGSVVLLALAVGLLTTAPVWATGGQGTDCAGKFNEDGTVYLGCENPGKVCTIGNKQGKCGDTVSQKNCDCNP